jgi:dTDP-4-dehydrorhamnose reductase
MISEDLYFDNSGIELFGTYANHKPKWIPEEFARKMDVQDEQEVTNVIAELRPDIIIHLAAISFPNVCEKDPARGERVNNPPAFIAALKTYVPKAVVVFTSSALVYDGEYAPYKPDFDTTAVPPICAYGVSKLKAEEIVLSSMPNAVVLRLSNLLGPSCVYRHGEYKFM